MVVNLTHIVGWSVMCAVLSSARFCWLCVFGLPCLLSNFTISHPSVPLCQHLERKADLYPGLYIFHYIVIHPKIIVSCIDVFMELWNKDNCYMLLLLFLL